MHGLIACAALGTCMCAARSVVAVDRCALVVVLEGVRCAARSGLRFMVVVVVVTCVVSSVGSGLSQCEHCRVVNDLVAVEALQHHYLLLVHSIEASRHVASNGGGSRLSQDNHYGVVDDIAAIEAIQPHALAVR
eukprot:2363400-Amphidinium_carterae.1